MTISTTQLLSLLLPILLQASSQGTSLPNALSYHNDGTARAFQGVYGSNFNETITFCNFKEKPWELNSWGIIPSIAQSSDSGQSQYNVKGALLYGGVYLAANGSAVWKGLGFSQNGPYDCAFALGPKGQIARGYYTFLAQSNGSTSAGETGPWILYYKHEPTPGEPIISDVVLDEYQADLEAEACNLVYRTYFWGFDDSTLGTVY